MSGPLVSVCMPVFNGLPYVRTAVESVLSQSLTDFELIVADNASTDGTLHALESFGDPRLRIVRNPVNVGAIPNWNRVVSEARGRYVKMLPADDVLYPACLERQVAAMRDHDDVELVAGKRDVIDAEGRPLIRAHGLGSMSGKVDGRDALRAAVRAGANLFGEPGSILVRRASLPPPPVFVEDLPYVVDLRLWCRLLSQGALFAIPDALNAFRISESSQSAALARVQRRQTQTLLRSVAAEVEATRVDVARGFTQAAVRSWLRRSVFGLARMRQRFRRERPLPQATVS